MWLFTKYGFFSAVCARQGVGKYGMPADPNRIMIRARLVEHLEALKRQFPELLGQCEIRGFEGSDYPFRIFVEKPTWSKIIAALAEEIGYDNFKSEVAHYQGRAGAGYESALHAVWSIMRKLQK